MGTTKFSSTLFGFAILLSGFAALCYQVTWQRVLTQSIGSDATATVLIVTIFMFWLGIGAALSQILLRYSRRRVAFSYAAIEFLIAFCGLVSIPVLRSANAAFAGLGIDSVWVVFSLIC